MASAAETRAGESESGGALDGQGEQPAPHDNAAKLLVAGVAMRPRGEDMAISATMVLAAPEQDDRSRNLFVFSKHAGAGLGAFRLEFSSPRELRGTGLLSVRTEAGARHWMFASGTKSAREISKASGSRYFLDTQLRLDDLLPGPFDDYDHEISGKEEVDDRLCTVVDSVPAGATAPGFARRRMWIDETYMLPLKIEYYAGADAGEPAWRYEAKKVQKVQDYWTVMASHITVPPTGRSTRIIVSSVVYDQSMPDSLFTPEALVDPATTEPFRP